MSEATAYMITRCLLDVHLNGGGTPKNVAVKTGTTNFDNATIDKLVADNKRLTSALQMITNITISVDSSF